MPKTDVKNEKIEAIPAKSAVNAIRKLQSVHVNLNDKTIELSFMITPDSGPTLFKNVTLRDGTSTSASMSLGETGYSTPDGFENVAADVKTFVEAVVAAVDAL